MGRQGSRAASAELTQNKLSSRRPRACPFRPVCPAGIAAPALDHGNSAAYLLRNFHEKRNHCRSCRTRRAGGAPGLEANYDNVENLLRSLLDPKETVSG